MGATPILAHDDELLELQVIPELAHDLGVLGRRVAVPLGPIGEPEAWVVDRDAPEVVAQARDHLAVQEAPGGIAVAHEDRPACALVDEVHADTVRLEPPRLEGKQLG